MVEVSPTGAPANYNDGQTISVHSTAVYQATFYRDNTTGLPDSIQPTAVIDGTGYGTVPEMLNIVSDCFSKIFDIWSELKLSWSGDSADAAQKLQTDLDQVQKRLYGVKILPGQTAPGLRSDSSSDVPGVISQMSSVAASASVNYSNAEVGNADMFKKMDEAIDWHPLPPEDLDDGSQDSSGDSTKPSTDSWDYAPVIEKF